MRFDVVNLGCRVNRVESDSIAAKLVDHAWVIDRVNPQVVVVNTCTVTSEADKKTRKTVRRVLKDYPEATVLVTGCAAAMTPEVYRAMSDRVRLVGKAGVVEAALSLGDDSLHGHLPAQAVRFGEDFPTRVGIKIQDGCDNACTYCIVHVARGKSTSLDCEECLSEAKRHYLAGAREIVLTGIDLGNYDFKGMRLEGLLARLVDELPEARIRISSIEPPSITDGIVDMIVRSEGRICRHLHLPLQSGSSKVLAEMDRHYDARAFRDLVDTLYERIPRMSLSTDIIVGFPGETEEDFQQTLDMVEYCRFSKVHIFRYSRRAGTPAAVREDQVPAEVVSDRARRLRDLAAKVRRQEQQRRLGTSEGVLVEEDGQGTTESFFTVRFDQPVTRGALLDCTLARLDENGVFRV